MRIPFTGWLGMSAALLLWSAPTASAQQVGFSVSPEVLRTGQAATAKFTVMGTQHAQQPQLPTIDGLQVSYMGPFRQRMNRNGQVEESITFNYSVVPLKPGDYDLGSFTYRYNGADYGIPATKIKVLPPGGSGQNTKKQEVDWDSLIFCTMETRTPEVYNQQFMDVELAIYFKDHLRLDSQVQPINLPTAGLTIKEMRALSEKREVVNGEIYEVRRFLIKFQAITEGTFILEPTLRAHILVNRQRRRSGSLFDEMFGSLSRYEKHPIDLHPKALTLTVNPIPTENRPAGYQGAVGEFALKVEASPRAIQAGDPVTIRTTISGQGNIETVTAPALELGENFRVYDAKLISKELNQANSSGRKIFEQVIIPRESGEITLPPLRFSFFNPILKTYVELKKEGLALRVRESDQPAAAVVMAPGGTPAARELKVIDVDIAYLKPLPRNWRKINEQAALPLPGWIHGVPPAALAFLFFATRQRRQRMGNEQLQRRQAAPRKARAGLNRAQNALTNSDHQEFYEAVYQTVFDFFSNRLGWAPGEFDIGKLTQHLQQQGCPSNHIDFLRTLLTDAEALRYGAGLSDTARDAANRDSLDQLAALLKRSSRS